MPNIRIHIEDNKTMDELLSSVTKFYPMGTSTEINLYGYNALLDITNRKINQLIAEELPTSCNQLIKEVGERFSNFSITPEFERQFPNYALNIELTKVDSREVTIIYNLKLKISLLVNFFTIFHDETIIHKNSSSFHHNFMPIITNVISSTSRITDSKNHHFDLLKTIVESIFNEHKFINHYLLFNKKINNGTPYGFQPDSSNEYSVYHFLFDNDYNVSPPPHVAP